MNWYVAEKNLIQKSYRTAGIKARDDADKILAELGFAPLVVTGADGRDRLSKFQKLKVHYTIKQNWQKAFEKVKRGDSVIVQFPAINHTLFLDSVIKKAVKHDVTVIALIHDLELLRLSVANEVGFLTRRRLKKEELSVLKLFSKIIVHNDSMKEYMHKNLAIPRGKMVCLEIFDYLTDKTTFADRKIFRTVTVAGNLDKNKSGYVYALPDGIDWALYGPNYTGSKNYHGSYPPEKLPLVLNGGFGLVWDGPSADSCVGAWGGYLRYNNPHKASLYLASGLPVIIWKDAALADFIIKNNCGITVNSLSEIPRILSSLSKEHYDAMRQNALDVSSKLRRGYFLKKAVSRAQDTAQTER